VKDPLLKLAITLGRVTRRLGLAMGVIFLFVGLTPLVEWLARPLAQPWTTVDRGVLIVLSGSTASSKDRLRT
jgi:hypothetical protein